MSNTFNIKRTETNGDGVALYSVAHPRPTSKIDVIIDALSVAQNSVWSALNQEALAYAVELKTELAKPEQEPYFCKDCGKGLLGKEHIHTCSPQVKREWVGLTDEEIENLMNATGIFGGLTPDEIALARLIEAKLKELNK